MLSKHPSIFYHPTEYLAHLFLKASMPDGKGCYTPIGDTGIQLKRYWSKG